MSFSEICNGKIYVVIQFSCQFMKSKDADAKKEQHKLNSIFALKIDTFQNSFAKAYNRKGRSFLEGQSCILSSVFVTRSKRHQYGFLAYLGQGQLQEWTEHSPTDFRKFETSRDNQKIISTSFEHLKNV